MQDDESTSTGKEFQYATLSYMEVRRLVAYLPQGVVTRDIWTHTHVAVQLMFVQTKKNNRVHIHVCTIYMYLVKCIDSCNSFHYIAVVEIEVMGRTQW